MANIQVRGTSLALKVESTEGTPVAPSAGADFVPIQSDLSVEPSFEVLDNDELRSTIGKAKKILGIESPTASMSLYLKPSGTSGSAPNYGATLLKGLFGAVDDAGVEHNTVAASTVALVKVDTGEGATYMRGQGLLIQDPVNGYSIRAVHSISSNDLTMGFNVANAPGTGVDLGECVTYYPANSDHQSLSLWRYLGNAGGIDMVSGCKVVSAAFNFEAGQLINVSYSLEGLSYFVNPVSITSSNNKLDFDDGSERNATIPVKMYKSPHELAEAIQLAMNDVTADAITVSYSNTTGKYTITSAGGTLELLWNTGANTANTIGTTIGFLVAADDTGVLTYTSDNAATYATPATPAFDAMDPLVAKNMEILIGDATDYQTVSCQSVKITINVPKANISDMSAASGVSGSVATERTVEIEVGGYLSKYDADKFRRYTNNTETRMQLAFGQKTGSNWVKGKCGYVYLPTCSVEGYTLADVNGLYGLNTKLSSFVDANNNGEVYLGFL